jgi:hypothetical protein
MTEIRKIITLREVVFSELGHDAPRPEEIVVVMAIADGGRLRNRCGTAPIR